MKMHVVYFTSNQIQETGTGYPIQTTKPGGYPGTRVPDESTNSYTVKTFQLTDKWQYKNKISSWLALGKYLIYSSFTVNQFMKVTTLNDQRKIEIIRGISVSI